MRAVGEDIVVVSKIYFKQEQTTHVGAIDGHGVQNVQSQVHTPLVPDHHRIFLSTRSQSPFRVYAIQVDVRSIIGHSASANYYNIAMNPIEFQHQLSLAPTELELESAIEYNMDLGNAEQLGYNIDENDLSSVFVSFWYNYI